MFDNDPENDPDRQDKKALTRRSFLVLGVAATAGSAIWFASESHPIAAQESTARPHDVEIVLFSAAGERQQTVQVPAVTKTEAEWKQQLSPGAFEITRHADTEFAFSGKYWNQHDRGLYRCICCNTALFSSDTKFESGTGWPSFWQPVAKQNVHETTDNSLGMGRTAVSCARCDAHLGHVFNDGPKPTYLRYCMNSASLNFAKFA